MRETWRGVRLSVVANRVPSTVACTPGLPTRTCRAAAAASPLWRPAVGSAKTNKTVLYPPPCPTRDALLLAWTPLAIRPEGWRLEPTGTRGHSEATSRGDRAMSASSSARFRGSDGLPPSFPLLLVFAAGVLVGWPRCSDKEWEAPACGNLRPDRWWWITTRPFSASAIWISSARRSRRVTRKGHWCVC